MNEVEQVLRELAQMPLRLVEALSLTEDHAWMELDQRCNLLLVNLNNTALTPQQQQRYQRLTAGLMQSYQAMQKIAAERDAQCAQQEISLVQQKHRFVEVILEQSLEYTSLLTQHYEQPQCDNLQASVSQLCRLITQKKRSKVGEELLDIYGFILSTLSTLHERQGDEYQQACLQIYTLLSEVKETWHWVGQELQNDEQLLAQTASYASTAR